LGAGLDGLLKKEAQGVNSSIVTFSKKAFEQILSISIITQPIPQFASLLAHRSVIHVQHIFIRPISNEELAPLTQLLAMTTSSTNRIAN